MSKKYLLKKVTSIPIYRGVLVILFTNSSKKIRKYTSFKDKIPYAHCIIDSYKGIEGYYVILNFNYKYRKITHGTIAHEAIHAAQFLADNRGFIADFNNDEPIAYITEWITDQIYKFIKKKGFNVY